MLLRLFLRAGRGGAFVRAGPGHPLHSPGAGSQRRPRAGGRAPGGAAPGGTLSVPPGCPGTTGHSREQTDLREAPLLFLNSP